MRVMRKKLNVFMLQLPIYYILELEISIGANADIPKMKQNKLSLLQKGGCNFYCFS